MLVVCSDIHVLGSPLMSSETTRMQDLASEFSKIFRGWHPRTLTAGGGDPVPYPARPLAGREAQAPRCLDPNLGPPQLFSRGWHCCVPGSNGYCRPDVLRMIGLACSDEFSSFLSIRTKVRTPVPSTGKVCSAQWYRNVDPVGRRHEYTGGFPREMSATATWCMPVGSCLQCRGASAIWFVKHWWHLTSSTLVSVWPCCTPLRTWISGCLQKVQEPSLINASDVAISK